MVDTGTPRLGLLKLEEYTRNNTWGPVFNIGALDRVDDAFGSSSVVVDGNITLSADDFIENEARSMVLLLSGAGGFTVTHPAVDKPYLVVNDCLADIVLKPNGGTGATVRAGTQVWYFTSADGTAGYVADPGIGDLLPPNGPVDFNGQKLTNVAKGTGSNDAATLSNKVHELAAPTAPLAMNGQKVTGLGNGSDPQDAATKGQLDTIAGSASAAAQSAAAAANALASLNAKFRIVTSLPDPAALPEGAVVFLIA